MKKMIFIVIALCFAILSCSCANSQEPVSLSDFSEVEISDFGLSIAEYSVPEVYLDEEYRAKYYEGTLLEQYSYDPLELRYFADFKDSVYLIYDCELQTTMSRGFDIYRLDKASGSAEKAAEIRSDVQKAIFSVAVSDDAVYWSDFTTDYKWEIMEYSPESGNVSVILEAEAEDGRVPCITCVNNCLMWYDGDETSCNLMQYDLESGTLSEAASNVLAENPYQRTAGTAYAESTSSGIRVINGGSKTDIAADAFNFTLVAAGDNKIVWYRENPDTSKTIYFYDNGKTCDATIIGYMGAGIIGDYFYLNTSDGGISFIDVESNSVCTAAGDNSWAYSFGNSVGVEGENGICLISA